MVKLYRQAKSRIQRTKLVTVSMKPIAIVSFDFANTLAKFRYPPAAVYARVAQEYGVELKAEDVGKAFKSNYKRLWSSHPNFGRESIASRNFWHQVVSSTLSESGMTGGSRHEKQRTRISNHLYDAFATDELWKVDDSGVTLLEQLKSENLKLIIISNMDERIEAILKSLRIRQYFDAVFSSYDTGFTKPDKRIFDRALFTVDAEKKLGAKSAVHIGDDFDNDYTGARNAGWNALWLNEGGESSSIPEKFVVTSLKEVPRKINLLYSSS